MKNMIGTYRTPKQLKYVEIKIHNNPLRRFHYVSLFFFQPNHPPAKPSARILTTAEAPKANAPAVGMPKPAWSGFLSPSKSQKLGGHLPETWDAPEISMRTSEDVSGPVRRSPARFLEKHRGRNAMELVKLAICPKKLDSSLPFCHLGDVSSGFLKSEHVRTVKYVHFRGPRVASTTSCDMSPGPPRRARSVPRCSATRAPPGQRSIQIYPDLSIQIYTDLSNL